MVVGVDHNQIRDGVEIGICGAVVEFGLPAVADINYDLLRGAEGLEKRLNQRVIVALTPLMLVNPDQRLPVGGKIKAPAFFSNLHNDTLLAAESRSSLSLHYKVPAAAVKFGLTLKIPEKLL